jgi:two-component system, OmpR family, response regulator
MKKNNITIFLVDDDALFLKSLEIDFREHTSYVIKTFATGESCLDHLSEGPDMIILDYHLNGIDKSAMDGITTLQKITSENPEIAVVMLSSQDKIDVAVECMHHKAFDYIVKSETAFYRLQRNIRFLLNNRRIQNELSWYIHKSHTN